MRMGNKIKKIISVPEEYEKAIQEKADKMGVTFNAYITFLLSGITKNQQYDELTSYVKKHRREEREGEK